jgi:hypothetical protein
MSTVSSLRRAIDPAAARAAGALRRFAIGATTQVLWQLLGFRMPDGSTETRTAEPFTGIGFYARPPADGQPEAIAVMVGDAKAPMIVGLRDEATRAKVAAAIAAGETMAFNAVAVVYLKADGTVEIRTPTGTPQRMVRGEDQNTAIKNFADAVQTIVDAIILTIDKLNTASPALGGSPGQVSAYTGAEGTLVGAQKTAFDNAVTALKNAADAWLATVGKVE